jgi:hypothetical protein
MFLFENYVLPGFLRLCRRPDDHIQSKYVAFESNNKNVGLDGIICIYVNGD